MSSSSALRACVRACVAVLRRFGSSSLSSFSVFLRRFTSVAVFRRHCSPCVVGLRRHRRCRRHRRRHHRRLVSLPSFSVLLRASVYVVGAYGTDGDGRGTRWRSRRDWMRRNVNIQNAGRTVKWGRRGEPTSCITLQHPPILSIHAWRAHKEPVRTRAAPPRIPQADPTTAAKKTRPKGFASRELDARLSPRTRRASVWGRCIGNWRRQWGAGESCSCP